MTRKIQVHQVDAFTRERFTGNPAGVVLNADGLSETQMLAIARELNNADTAFILAPENNEYGVRARFFTPRTEVGFVGHATVAAHYVPDGPPRSRALLLLAGAARGILDESSTGSDLQLTAMRSLVSCSRRPRRRR